MRKPYLAHLGEFAGVRCFLVDGTWVRNKRDVDFTNGAHHYTRPYIPEDEIWVDREAPGADELGFLVRHQFRERELMLSGLSYLQALDRANRSERRERRSRLTQPRLPLARARRSVRRELIGFLDGDAVWIVDGSEVRARFDPNFTHGGHAWRYRFIPRREIWIDDAVAERELDVTLAHERHELVLMRDGMRYDDAHELALAVEKRLRKRPLRARAIASPLRRLMRA
jgi:hypothetical protein